MIKNWERDLPGLGEDVVATRVETVKGRFDFGPTTAHKGHEMRKALDVQARHVADLLGIR